MRDHAYDDLSRCLVCEVENLRALKPRTKTRTFRAHPRRFSKTTLGCGALGTNFRFASVALAFIIAAVPVQSRNFFSELKRRNVYKVAVAYAVVTWLLVQIATQVFPFFEVPNWAVRFVILILALGFPVALVLAWAFEITPEGIKRADEVSPDESIRHHTGRKLVALTVVVGLIAAALFAWPFLRSKVAVTSVNPSSALAAPEKSIAVLPFENLSDEKANAYFADGVQDEILTCLAKMAELRVISRTSVMQYKTGTKRNLREIGQQLGVTHLLEGAVQRAGGKVRVTAQLIDVRNDAHLWAQTYDRDLADIFAIQSEIAKAIADQLQAKLSPKEKKAIEQPPTSDLTAFELYSQAKTILLTRIQNVTNEQDVRQAVELLNQAVRRDPSFFDAYCQLVLAHGYIYAILGIDHTPARLAQAEAALQAASRLRPDAGETHLARAQYLYYGLHDYAGALAELESARRDLSHDARIFELTGYILRRRGQQEDGLRYLERAIELDPRNFFILQQVAFTYTNMGRFAEAIAALDRALAIVPNDNDLRTIRDHDEFCWKADIRPLHQTIDSILAQGPGAIAPSADGWFFCAMVERDPATAERALVALGDNICWGESAINLSRKFGEGMLARITKDETRARAAFDAARAEQEKIVQAQPDYGPALCVLSMIDAALGRKEAALEEGRRAIELLPVEKDTINGSRMIQYFAITAAWAGENDLALEQMQRGLRAPAGSIALSYGVLKLHPFWDPLRGDPRFEKIVADLAPK